MAMRLLVEGLFVEGLLVDWVRYDRLCDSRLL